MVIPRYIKDPSCECRADNAADGGKSHHDAHHGTKDPFVVILPDDRSPQNGDAAEAEREGDEKEKEHPRPMDEGQGEHAHGHQKEGQHRDAPLVEKIAEPAEDEPSDNAEKRYGRGDETGTGAGDSDHAQLRHDVDDHRSQGHETDGLRKGEIYKRPVFQDGSIRFLRGILMGIRAGGSPLGQRDSIGRIAVFLRGIANDQRQGYADDPYGQPENNHRRSPSVGVNQPDDYREQKPAGAESGGHDGQGFPDVLTKPLGDGRHGDDAGAAAGPESHENHGPVKHGQGLGIAEEDETRPQDDHPGEHKEARSETVREKTDQRRQDAHLQPPETQGKRYLRMAPAELPNQWFKKSGKSVKDNTADKETDGETGQDNPPAVKYFQTHGHL